MPAFYDGQQDYIQKLNELYAYFMAGPFNAVPLAGGVVMTGPLTIPTLTVGAGGATGPAPGVFDDTARFVNAKWVNQRGMAYQSARGIGLSAGTTVMLESQIGHWFQFSGPGCTLSVGLVSNVYAGRSFTVCATYAGTLDFSGAGVFLPDAPSPVSSYTMASGEVATFTHNGFGGWVILSTGMAPRAVAGTYAPKANPTFTGTVSGITKGMVGLGNVDNTSDANKPVSTAQATALNLKANAASPSTTGLFTHNGTRMSLTTGTDYWTTHKNSTLSTAASLYYNPAGTLIGAIGVSGGAIPAGDGSAFALRSYGTLFLESDGAVVAPARDGILNLGFTTFRWGNSYFTVAPTITSDAREKTGFRSLTASEMAAACDIARAIGVYKWKSAVAEKGEDNAREHIGPTVQCAIEIMESHGLDPFNYGFICHDEWPEKTIAHEAVEDEQLARPAWIEHHPAGDRYAFRYDELNQFIAAGLEARQTAIEARLAALESSGV